MSRGIQHPDLEILEIFRDKPLGIAPRVAKVRWRGKIAVLKDYSGKPTVIRELISRAQAWSELAVMRRLQGVEGIPELFGTFGPLAWVMEYIEGKPIGRYKEPGSLPDPVYRQLAETVHAMHERRTVHLDLRQRKNILIREDGRPFLVDFGNAWAVCGHTAAHGLMLKRLQSIDISALLKFKNRIFPHLLTETDRELLRRHRRVRRLWFVKPGKRRERDRIR